MEYEMEWWRIILLFGSAVVGSAIFALGESARIKHEDSE